MNCSLKETAPEAHAKMKDSRLGHAVWTCPVLGKQICQWCCLHIADVANPTTRERSSQGFPEYAENVPAISGRELDSVWETCGRCRNR